MKRIAYKTLMARGMEEFIEKKSRFIGHGIPVTSEEQALSELKALRLQYADASHNCFAYIIGPNKGIMRYSDDGEPGGTAGLPIIEVMKARDVTDALVVVTRYFGGVLLGAGGLTRAYAKGAALGVDAAGVGVMHPTAVYLMDVDYPLLGRVEHFLKDEPVIVEDKAFSDVVTLTLIVRAVDEEAFQARLTSATDGRVEPVRFDEMYRAWPEDAER